MSTQIAVRLPDALVVEIDAAVSSGQVESRAELVRRALERELRHRAAVRDAQILSVDPADDLQPLVDWSYSGLTLDD